jgi:SnoaL-like domain
MTTVIDDLTAAIEAGHGLADDVFTDDAVLDATVPNWRFEVRGGAAVRRQLAEWFADPATFEALARTPLPDGELVEFTLTWEEGGVPHACHQAHLLRLRDGRIAHDTAFCGGRWPASLLAEMEEARRAAG